MLQSKCFHSLFAWEERGQSEIILFPPNIVCLTSELMLFRAEKGNPAKRIFFLIFEKDEPTIVYFESCSKKVTVLKVVQRKSLFVPNETSDRFLPPPGHQSPIMYPQHLIISHGAQENKDIFERENNWR